MYRMTEWDDVRWRRHPKNPVMKPKNRTGGNGIISPTPPVLKLSIGLFPIFAESMYGLIDKDAVGGNTLGHEGIS